MLAAMSTRPLLSLKNIAMAIAISIWSPQSGTIPIKTPNPTETAFIVLVSPALRMRL